MNFGKTLSRIVITLPFAFVITACGIKGPLYLPSEDSTTETQQRSTDQTNNAEPQG